MVIVYAARAMRHKLLLSLLLGLTCAVGCAPSLGDGCQTGQDCSVNGDRFCDTAQPGGYCTILDCEPGSCGDEGRCVRFRPDEPRLSRDWCMAKCGSTGDCSRDRYVCRSADELNEQRGASADAGISVPRVAEVLDSNKDGKFCVVKEE